MYAFRVTKEAMKEVDYRKLSREELREHIALGLEYMFKEDRNYLNITSIDEAVETERNVKNKEEFIKDRNNFWFISENCTAPYYTKHQLATYFANQFYDSMHNNGSRYIA